MDTYRTAITACVAAVLATLLILPAAAQNISSSAGTARMTVTVEARHGKDIPDVRQEDVTVMQGNARDKVTDWTPVESGPGVEFFFLIDDATDTSALGSQLNELRQFIQSLPNSVKVGVGYMRNGTVDFTQTLTTDHAQAAKSLRLTLGDPGASSSPYFSLQELIKHWPDSGAAREVVMVTDGIDRFYDGGDQLDPYVDSAIAAAQRAGVVVSAIYSRSEGHFGHTLWRINWGQNYLSQIADETGGEAYYLANENPVTFRPYLDDIDTRLKHQYVLRFIPQPQKKAGLERVKLKTEVHNAELVGPQRVYISANQ